MRENGVNLLVRDAAQMLVQNHDAICRRLPAKEGGECDYREGLQWGQRRAAVFIMAGYCRSGGPRARRLVRKEIRRWIENFKLWHGQFARKAVAS